ncbi:MAG: hypothetical protein J6E42_07900 [Firmicutes bacterium]|nr:hypothetical protein [Bacillota bacterium]
MYGSVVAPTYTPVVTDDTRVTGFYDATGSLKLQLAGRHNSGAMNEDGGSLEIVQYNASNGFAYAVIRTISHISHNLDTVNHVVDPLFREESPG